MTEISAAPSTPYTGRTAWARNLQTPFREFLRTETGSAAVLLAATIAALAWINMDAASYERVWHTELSIRLGSADVSQDLRHWVSSGLMTFFFFVVGLEARREFDLGELRERSRVALPVMAGLYGMIVPIAIYLIANAGRPSAHGWGAAMSTDTAFALGMLALVGPRFPERLRSFVLTVSVVDDLLALFVIAIFYSKNVRSGPLFVAIGIFLATYLFRRTGSRQGLIYLLLGTAAWIAMFKSGVDPVVVGLGMGLLTLAYSAPRLDLERATDLFRLFREQPTPELARSAQIGVATAISPNERLTQIYHPWTSYVVVPIFALSNAGIVVNGGFLARAYTSPITLGILIGYVAGKPIGIAGGAWVVSKLSRGRFTPPVGWAAVLGAGTIAGIGFTVSLLISGLAFTGDQLEEAKLGVLTAALAASLGTWVLFQGTALLPTRLQFRALIGTATTLEDLAVPVDPDRDHIRGSHDALVTLVEYGDFECPYCGQAEPVLRELLAGHGEVRYVWRHLPLSDVHPHAQLAAEAAEIAGMRGQFWEMHDLLFRHQEALRPNELVGYAEQLGLDGKEFREALHRRAGASRVAEDVDSADLSNVSGTPTFFINGRRHYGAYDITSLSEAVRAAKIRAYLDTSPAS
ncbi:MAG: Na+/H+ antiporter NhaA [Frankia sp.]